MEWMGPLARLKEKTAGERRPPGGAVVGKQHLSSRPPSEPTRKESGSQGDGAREDTPTETQPRACGAATQDGSEAEGMEDMSASPSGSEEAAAAPA